MMELQFNDTACQRIGHVRAASRRCSWELRSCSKRTQDFSGQVALVAEMESPMDACLAGLTALSAALTGTVATLHADGGRVADLLRVTADRIQIHPTVTATLNRAAVRRHRRGIARRRQHRRPVVLIIALRAAIKPRRRPPSRNSAFRVARNLANLASIRGARG